MFQIYKQEPVFIKDRTLIERIFSLPWKPFVKTKTVVNPACPPEGQTYRIGNQIHCRPEQYAELKKQTNSSFVLDGNWNCYFKKESQRND